MMKFRLKRGIKRWKFKIFSKQFSLQKKRYYRYFLGTGLGPKSYAIINQGTASKLIESKPEEFRVFIEEVVEYLNIEKEKKKPNQNYLILNQT